MSDSPFRTPVRVEELDEALSALRESGHRVTAARRMVLEALLSADGPASAEYLARKMGGASAPMDVASVHRNLVQLERLGLVRHVHIGHGPGLYAIVGGADREYIACERCGRVTSVDPEKLDTIRATIRRRFGYEARFTHFPILGLCRSCSKELRTGRTDEGADGGHGHGEHEHLDTEHQHEHSHGDHVHSHPHVHGEEPGGPHQHEHDA
jgi:Fur family ferric uptake transcriptional regulator